MTIVEGNLTKFKKLLKKKMSIQDIEECLSNLGMELKSYENGELKIEITAERIDLITIEGLARAVNCYMGFVKRYEEIKVNKSNYVLNIDSSIKKYPNNACCRAFVIKNVRLCEDDIREIMHVQEKIHDTYGRKRKKASMGFYDLDKISFPITYCAKKPGTVKFVPLGMNVEVTGTEILKQHPTGKEYAHLLMGSDKYPFHIDNGGQVLSMPPIINSDSLGKLDSKTKNIFMETTGLDSDVLDNIVVIIATMFYDLGGEIYEVKIKDEKEIFISPNLKTRKRSISTEFVNKLIGLKLRSDNIKDLLLKMEYDVLSVLGDKITFEVPACRVDIWHDVDIVDDVARAYGYNNIVPTLPNVSTIGGMLPINLLKEDISDFLSNLGLIEVRTFALTSEEDQYKKMNVPIKDHILLGKNTTDKSINMVREWLLPETFKALVANRNKTYPQNVFEVGEVVVPDKKEDSKARNVNKLCSILCGEKADYTLIKQILDSLFEFLGLIYVLEESKHNSFIEGRAGKVIVNKKEIGVVGEIHPQVLTNLGLNYPVAAFEINLNSLIELK
jgi:phenylalanyl-tRNA synthetase beta chain